MKTSNLLYISILLFSFYVFESCQKETQTPLENVSKLTMLTANIYIYDSVYTNWGLSNQTLVYALSGTSYLQDYSLDKVQFYKDGTFAEVRPNGILYHGTWSMNVDSSQLITASPGFSGTAVIDTLTMTKLVWRDLNTHNRGVQIPKK